MSSLLKGLKLFIGLPVRLHNRWYKASPVMRERGSSMVLRMVAIGLEVHGVPHGWTISGAIELRDGHPVMNRLI